MNMFFCPSSTILKECYVCFILAHGIVLAGSGVAFSAFLIPRLIEEKMVPNLDSVSWIGSLIFIVCAVGSICFSFVSAKLGRVRNLQCAFIIYIIGYLILILAPNVQFIYLGIGVNAIGVVISIPMYATYVSEICHPKRRGIFVSMDGVIQSIGISLDYLLNSFLPWRVIAIIWIVTSILGLMQSLLVPETSYWYMNQGQIDLAKESMLWFQPNLTLYDVDLHIEGMKNSIQNDSKTKTDRRSFFHTLCEMKYLKPFFFGTILSILCTGAGRAVLISYIINVFEALNTPYNSESLATWFGVADFVGSFLCLIIVYKFNRLFCLYTFSSVAVLSMVVTIGYQFYLSTSENSLPYLPVIGLFIYNMIMTTGFYAINHVIIVEMQFAEFRGQIMSFVLFTGFVMCFIYTKLFPYANQRVEIEYIFLFFLLNIITAVLLVFFFIPDNTEKLFYETGALKNKKKKQGTIQI